MNNFEKIKACKNIIEMACFLSSSDLAEILEKEQTIPNEYFYNYWLNKEVTNEENNYRNEIR